VATWSVYLMLVALLVAVAWAALAKVDMVTRAESRVIPVGREQVIASLEGGILRELKVREGEAVASNQRNQALLEREVVMAQTMAAKGLMSEVEVMRLRRQVNDLALVTQERINRFRQDASAELVKAQTELTMLGEQQVVRDDILKRTTLTSPVRGLVKNIRMNTVGGVVSPGAPVMEIVPVDEQVLVELRIKPSDIGWVRVGHPVEIKLSAYDFTVYGSLHGTVDTVSPDALSDNGGPAGNGDATWYRALVRADASQLKAGSKALTVLPGMVGTAEIRTGQRSVLSFLLRPMMKATEAFTER
jgi:membrane fusion protein, adhesin transport system